MVMRPFIFDPNILQYFGLFLWYKKLTFSKKMEFPPFPPRTRRRSPTVTSCTSIDFKSSLFTFSDDVQKELDSIKSSTNPFFTSMDDSPITSISSSDTNVFHRRVPTAPSFSFLNSANSNLPLSRRPIQQKPPEMIKDSFIITKQFSCIPKPADFTVPIKEGQEVYSQLVNDLEIMINPKELGFIPSSFWPEGQFLLRDLVTDYFMKECGPDSRFSHKLFNALQKVQHDPFYSCFFGVEWLNENALLVNGPLFGTILGMKDYEEELFGSYGQLAIHGFVSQNESEALSFVDSSQLEGVDFVTIRIYVHNNGVFTQSSTEHDIISARWSRRKYSKSGPHVPL